MATCSVALTGIGPPVSAYALIQGQSVSSRSFRFAALVAVLEADRWSCSTCARSCAER